MLYCHAGMNLAEMVPTQLALVATWRDVIVMRELPEHKLYKYDLFGFCPL